MDKIEDRETLRAEGQGPDGQIEKYPTLCPTLIGMRKTSVYLDDELVEKLTRLAGQMGCSQAEVLRAAIASFEPVLPQDRNFALAAGFERIDDDPRSISEIPKRELLQGFGE